MLKMFQRVTEKEEGKYRCWQVDEKFRSYEFFFKKQQTI